MNLAGIRGRRTLAAMTLLGALVAAVGCSGESEPSAESQISAVVGKSFEFMAARDWEAVDSTQCSSMRSESPRGDESPFDDTLASLRLDGVENIVVNGDSATADTRHYSTEDPSRMMREDITLIKENGAWVVC
ncbi:hypothetical protein ACIQYW_17485 [Rhodococcus erythropolis]|jgi:hypothetical protein|nr:hypothetical protein [uncultured Rhodococcus sp.]